MLDRILALTDTYRRERAELSFIDANLWIGRPRNPEFASGFSVAALHERLARYAITGGVVSHFGSIADNPARVNAETLQALEGSSLWAGVCLLPEMFQPATAGRAYLDDAIGRGARLARVFPTAHNFSLHGWCSGAMLQTMADCRLPLAIWHTETSWEEIRNLCESYPDLPVIVEGTPKKIIYYNRIYYPLLERCPNLYLELHNLVGYLAVEDIVAHFGAGHLLFGSYMPVCDPNAAIMMVTHARIATRDKARLAHQNLAGLVTGIVIP